VQVEAPKREPACADKRARQSFREPGGDFSNRKILEKTFKEMEGCIDLGFIFEDWLELLPVLETNSEEFVRVKGARERSWGRNVGLNPGFLPRFLPLFPSVLASCHFLFVSFVC
jgi:hypothetical protein